MDTAIKQDFTVKVAIMYILKKFGEAMEDEVLTDIATGVCEINYFTLKQCELELIDSGFIHSYNNGGTEYHLLTDKGNQALDFFVSKLLYSVRLKINDYIKSYTPGKRNSKFNCDIIPITDLDFNIFAEYIENGKTMLKIEFYAGSREQAEELVKKIRHNRDLMYGDLYKYIMKLASTVEKEDINENPRYEDFDDNMNFFE